MENLLKKIGSYTGIISGYLIVLGYSFYHFYYNHFNVEFYSYAASGEIIFAFLSVAIPIIFMLAVIILIYVIEERKEKKELDSYLNKIQKSNFFINFLIKIGIYILGFAMYVLFAFLIPMSLIGPFPFPDSIYSDLFFVLKLAFVSLVIISLVFNAFSYREKSKTLALFLFSSAIILYMSFLGNAKAIAIDHIKGEYTVYMKMKGGELKMSSNEQFYIGETKNYIFLYDTTNKSIESLNKNEMISITKTKK